MVKNEDIIKNNNEDKSNEQPNFLSSNINKVSNNENSSLNNNVFINIYDNNMNNERNKIKNLSEDEEEDNIIQKDSTEIIIKSLQQILDENENPRLREIIYNNSAKKIVRLFSRKFSGNNLNLNNSSPSKLNKIANKKKDKNFTFISDDSISNIIKDGFGIQKWFDGSKFVGYFKDSKSNGLGRFVDDENNYLFGNFIDDQIEGFGIYHNKNGTSYMGEWSNDLQDGIGIENWKDGSFYSGEFSEGKKNGLGHYIWSDGSEYRGEWKNNGLNGYGIYSYANKKKVYYGEWDNTMMNGFGELTWKNEGRKYVGYFLNDKRQGFGLFLWKNPFKVFVGFWDKGKQNGVAKYMDIKKKKFGIWKNGKLIKWFKSRDDVFQYIEPEYNNYLIFFEITFEQIKRMFIDDENW